MSRNRVEVPQEKKYEIERDELLLPFIYVFRLYVGCK
jgi:hypothetical protein